MRHVLKLAPLVALASMTALGGCGHPVPPAPVVPEVPPVPAIGLPPEVVPIEEPKPLRAYENVPQLQDLSLREKAGQLVMPRIEGAYWAADDPAAQQALAWVREAQVGGFVTGAAGSPYDLAAKFDMLQKAARLPLLIAADLESGPGQRFHGGTAFPGNMAIGATGQDSDAYTVGRIIAREARAVGIHMDFAPVVDVNNNPANPIINVRSFGEDPARVGQLGAAFVRGLRENGLLATAKHFPGHGNTGTDSHIALPVITEPLSRLDSVELVPFKSAVAAGVDAVMSAHIAVPALTGDSSLPSTLSRVVLDTVLRGQLGFKGLIVTDALNMGAVVSRYGASRAVVMALAAGADILLMPTDPAAAVDAIVRAVEHGEIDSSRLDASVERILEAKARLGLFHQRTVDLADIPRFVGTREDEAAAEDIARRSIVLVEDDSQLVPLAPARRRVLVVSVADEGSVSTGVQFAAELRRGGASVLAMRLYPASGPASYDSVRTAAHEAKLVVFVASPRPVAWQPNAVVIPDSAAALINALALEHLAVVLLSTGSPYLINQAPAVGTYVVAWSGTDAAERAAADAVLGRIPVTGRLPVSLPPRFPLGGGLTRAAVRQ